ncbi:hypothetical protein LCGC14_0597020 [marine sediment metagenome]|uniref:Uncharacterized protein n=1 Tax=marine sediment metagenome TaxID=412755 RepID=A0A0F9RGN9_9ZZZZ
MTKRSLWGIKKGKPGIKRLNKIGLQAREISEMHMNLYSELIELKKLLTTKADKEGLKPEISKAYTRHMQYGEMGAEAELTVRDWKEELY